MRLALMAAAIVVATAPLNAMGQRPADPPPERESPELTRDSNDPCGASAYHHLIGAERRAVEALDFEGPVRIIPLGGRVTMDFRPERINFDLDADGRVTGIRCG